MNSKLLLALFLGAAASVSAQNANDQAVQMNTKNTYTHQKHSAPAASSANRVDIWTNDFSNASDWVISSAVGNNSNWVIGTTGPAGSFPITAIASATAANGFALFDSDLDCSGNQVTNLTMANSADCSLFPNVILEFQQQYRRFNDSTFVFVSNDNGTTWVKYTVNGDFTTNDASVTNPEVTKVNITPTAGGQANVKVRFQFWSPSTYAGPGTGGPGCGYAWMIDDVKLATPPDFELMITETLHGDPVNDFEYGTYPLTQVAPISVFVVVRNEGALAQTGTVAYDITRAGTSVSAGSSDVFTIQPFTNDTLVIATNYTADQVGVYNVATTVLSDNTDFDPTNNTGSSDFSVTNYSYSGLNGLANAAGFTFSGSAAPYDPSKIAHTFNIINATPLKAIDIAVSSTSDDDIDLIIELFDLNDLTTALAVGDFRILSTHPTTAQYVTILIDEQQLAAGGLYVASVGSEATDKKFVFYGEAGDPDNASLVNVPNDAGVLTWFRTDLTPGIALNFDPAVGIADVNAPAVSMDVYPNPANDQLSWSIKNQEASAVAVSLVDMNGKVVFSKSISGKVVSYKDTLSLATFANGVYTLQVTSATGTSAQKVVIAH